MLDHAGITNLEPETKMNKATIMPSFIAKESTETDNIEVGGHAIDETVTTTTWSSLLNMLSSGVLFTITTLSEVLCNIYLIRKKRLLLLDPLPPTLADVVLGPNMVL